MYPLHPRQIAARPISPPSHTRRSPTSSWNLSRSAALTVTPTRPPNGFLLGLTQLTATLIAANLEGETVADTDEQAAAIVASPGIDPAVAVQNLLDHAVQPLAANPQLRARILELRASHDQVIDEVSVDTLLDAHGVVDTERARSVVESWAAYLAENRDEITALHVLYSQPAGRISFADLRELAERIQRPPYNWTPDIIWNAYAAIDVDLVRHADRHTVTDLVSLVRFAMGVENELVPYADKVQERYVAWLAQQVQAGATFSDRQRWWLDRIADVIATSAGISAEDLEVTGQVLGGVAA